MVCAPPEAPSSLHMHLPSHLLLQHLLNGPSARQWQNRMYSHTDKTYNSKSGGQMQGPSLHICDSKARPEAAAAQHTTVRRVPVRWGRDGRSACTVCCWAASRKTAHVCPSHSVLKHKVSGCAFAQAQAQSYTRMRESRGPATI